MLLSNMIETPTVLILGAGASAPYGYPLGSDLKDKIIHSLNAMVENENGWVEELDVDPFLVSEFTKKFEDSKRPSIDSFLDKQKEDFTQIGKIAIVDAIAKCEDPKIRDPKRLKSDIKMDEKDDWYTYLVEILYECDVDDVGKNLSIISFNYDRSLEYFLLKPLQGTFKELELEEDCAATIKQIPIIHMYGRLDSLPWEVPGDKGREYGAKCSSEDLLKISDNIQLVHEAASNITKYNADNLIKKARRIYFLGMDLYRNQANVNIFDLTNLQGKKLLATGHGFEEGERNRITTFFNSIQTPIRPRFNISDKKTLISIRKINPF